MEATMVSDTAKHYPVLLSEIISIITPQHGGTFIDCTFGQGGYSSKILSFNKTKVIALDRDIETQKIAEKILYKFNNRFIFKNIKFSQLDNLKLKNENIKGIIFDLGYSFTQIKDPKKGLSFNFNGDLNMQMGINNFSANDVINKLHAEELEKIFKYFGEEKEAKKIANEIIIVRKKKEIDTPTLVELIDRVKSKRYSKIHSATKVFQALRIFVNKEISELIYGLINASKILKKDGVLAVVTFHSLEDKIVKYFFKSLSENKSISRYAPKIDQPETLFKMIEKKPKTPSVKELKENISSRSAKLRYVIKKDNFYNFETDIFEKFDYLIKIENFGNRL
ncbi:MAG: ribosomal RNA small subunit methyltransferase H [Pelagibacterales bacterium MED-G41]|nr:MAG: ribosomal RNA small subunit methyltransferase H [Pelagibacterales bacterium MED-G41]